MKSFKLFSIQFVLFVATLYSFTIPLVLAESFLQHMAETKPSFFDELFPIELFYVLIGLPIFLITFTFASIFDFTWSHSKQEKKN